MGPKNTSACVSLRLALSIHREICKDETCELAIDWSAHLDDMLNVLDCYADVTDGTHGPRPNQARRAVERVQALSRRLAAAHGEKAPDEQGESK